jgi:hypothetical protein
MDYNQGIDGLWFVGESYDGLGTRWDCTFDVITVKPVIFLHEVMGTVMIN